MNMCILFSSLNETWGGVQLLKFWITATKLASLNPSRAIKFTFRLKSFEPPYPTSYVLNSIIAILL